MKHWALILLLATLASACASDATEAETTVAEAPVVEEQSPIAAPSIYPFLQDSLYGWMDESGAILVSPQFTAVGELSEGLIPAQVNGVWGFYDRDGHEVIEPQFYKARSLYENRAAVQVRGKYGYVDGAGSLVIGARFDAGWSFSEGLALVLQEGKFGYINAKGEWAIPAKFEECYPFSGGLALCYDATKGYGFLGKDGQYQIAPAFQEAWPFSEGMAAASNGVQWGFINASGDWIIQPQFEYAFGFSNGVALVKQNGLWGYIQPSGNFSIEPQFEDAWDFSNGLAAVKQDSFWGFANTSGQLVVDPQFDDYTKFEGELALVEQAGSQLYINTLGEVVQPHESLVATTKADSATDTVAVSASTPTAITVEASEEKPVQVTAIPQAVGSAQIKDVWTNRKGGLARYVTNYIFNQTDRQGPFLVLLGKTTEAYYTVEGDFGLTDGGQRYFAAKIYETHINGSRKFKNLADTTLVFNTSTESVLKERVLRGMWFWDSQGFYNHKILRPLRYQVGAVGEGFHLKVRRPNGNIYFWNFSGGQWHHREEKTADS